MIDTHNDVLSISASILGMGPFSVGVPALDFRKSVEENAKAENHHGILHMGSLSVDTRDAETWNPVPPWPDFRSQLESIKGVLPLVRQTLVEHAPQGSLAELFEGDSRLRNLDHALFKVARAATTRLLANLHSGDLERCLDAVNDLAGLGAGLTPAGDDWVLGCMLAMWGSMEPRKAEAWGSRMAAAAAPRTTLLSAAWLRAAAGGACSEPWHQWIHALFTGRTEDIRYSTRRLVQVGHTSGADSLAGFLSVLLMQ